MILAKSFCHIFTKKSFFFQSVYKCIHKSFRTSTSKVGNTISNNHLFSCIWFLSLPLWPLPSHQHNNKQRQFFPNLKRVTYSFQKWPMHCPANFENCEDVSCFYIMHFSHDVILWQILVYLYEERVICLWILIHNRILPRWEDMAF